MGTTSHVKARQNYLGIILQVALETCKENLALTGLETVKHAWNRAVKICPAEKDELSMHKVGVSDFFSFVVQESARHKIFEPDLALLHFLL